MPEIKQPKKPPQTCRNCGDQSYNLLKVKLFTQVDEVIEVCAECAADYQRHCPDCDVTYYSNNDGDYGYGHAWKDTLRWPYLIRRCSGCAPAYKENNKPLHIHSCKLCAETYASKKAKQDLCPRCADNYCKCPECKDVYITKKGGQYQTTKKGSPENVYAIRIKLCDACMDKAYNRCNICKHLELVAEGDGYVGEDGLCKVCRPAARQCDICYQPHPKARSHRVDGKQICHTCNDNRVGVCSDCGKYRIDIGARYHHHHDRGGRSQCVKCIGSPVMRYTFKKPPKFYGEGPLFYGYENEIEFDSENYERYSDMVRAWGAQHLDMFHLVHDGSMKYGIEVVSNPASFDFWKDLPEAHALPPVPNLVGMGTAGAHVHMSKSAFGAQHLLKFLNFISDNFDNFSPIFGRGLGHYCQECPVDYAEFVARGKEMQQNRDDKYWWINMKGGHTVEIRVFQAAETWAQLRSYIQLLDSVYHHTKDKSPNELKDWKDYYKYINRVEDYFILADCLEKNPRPMHLEVPKRGRGRAQFKNKKGKARIARLRPGRPRLQQQWSVPQEAMRVPQEYRIDAARMAINPGIVIADDVVGAVVDNNINIEWEE